MSKEIAPRITVDPAVRSGKPVIQGTRVPVDLIIGKLAGGMTPGVVAEEFGISIGDIRAALSYVAAVLATEEVRASA